jgi:hypothetical protein
VGTEVEIQQGLPLTRTTGPEADIRPTPEATRFTFDKPYAPPVGEPIQRELFGPPLSSAVEGAPVMHQDPATAQSVGVSRHMFGTARDTTIPGDPVMHQDPAIAQTVARQGNFQNEPSFPPREPVIETGKTHGMDLSELVEFKRWLQNEVFNQASIKSPMRPQAAIDASPELQFMQGMASVLKDEGELAVGKHLPDRYSAFMKANQQVHDAMTWLPSMQGSANQFSTGARGLKLSNLSGRRLLTVLPFAGGSIAAGVSGNPGSAAGLAAGAVGAELLGHGAEMYGHSLSGALLRDFQAKAGVLKNPAIPRLFVKSLVGIGSQKGEDDNAPSE